MNIPATTAKFSTEPWYWGGEPDANIRLAQIYSPLPMYPAAGENSTEPRYWSSEHDAMEELSQILLALPMYSAAGENSTEPRYWSSEHDAMDETLKDSTTQIVSKAAAELPTILSYWSSNYDTNEEPLKESSAQIGYALVPSDATGKIRRIIHLDQTAFWNAMVVLSDAQDLRLMDTATEFASINKSVFDASEPNPVMMKQLDQLIVAAHDEFFEVGIESWFSRDLQRLTIFDPPMVLQYLTTKLKDNYTNSEVLAEILRWASRQEASNIRALVIDLLSAGLGHMSSLVRDEAALGLAYLDEAVARDRLPRVLERETVPELREDLKELIRSLEN